MRIVHILVQEVTTRNRSNGPTESRILLQCQIFYNQTNFVTTGDCVNMCKTYPNQSNSRPEFVYDFAGAVAWYCPVSRLFQQPTQRIPSSRQTTRLEREMLETESFWLIWLFTFSSENRDTILSCSTHAITKMWSLRYRYVLVIFGAACKIVVDGGRICMHGTIFIRFYDGPLCGQRK